MGARVYDPYTGTFLQTDPIPGADANAYGYTSGDPVNHLDLSGDIEFINEGGGGEGGEGDDPDPGSGGGAGGGGVDDGGSGAAVANTWATEFDSTTGRPEPEYLVLDEKSEGQMANRGWTGDSLEDTVTNPAATHDVWDYTGDGEREPATAYISKDGGYVVVNDGDGRVVQVSDLNKPGWQPAWDTARFRR